MASDGTGTQTGPNRTERTGQTGLNSPHKGTLGSHKIRYIQQNPLPENCSEGYVVLFTSHPLPSFLPVTVHRLLYYIDDFFVLSLYLLQCGSTLLLQYCTHACLLFLESGVPPPPPSSSSSFFSHPSHSCFFCRWPGPPSFSLSLTPFSFLSTPLAPGGFRRLLSSLPLCLFLSL